MTKIYQSHFVNLLIARTRVKMVVMKQMTTVFLHGQFNNYKCLWSLYIFKRINLPLHTKPVILDFIKKI